MNKPHCMRGIEEEQVMKMMSHIYLLAFALTKNFVRSQMVGVAPRMPNCPI